MTTLQEQLENAKLSKECKIDLTMHTEQLELENSALPKRPVTVPEANLPSAVFAATITNQIHADGVRDSGAAAAERFRGEKSMHEATQRSTMAASTKGGREFSFSKRCEVSYFDCPKERNPFVESRSRTALSGKDACFVRQYASALTKSTVAREPKSDEASVAAAEAYKTAFRKYTGRDPSEKELEEVDRLHFSFDENGEVGVVQKPHTCYPHSHITNSNRRCVQCSNQVYRAEVPAVRGARDRFPGSVPVWSSTKNLSTMVAGDMHQPGHLKLTSITREALDTVVGPK